MKQRLLPILLLVAPLLLAGCDRTTNFTEQEHIQRAKDFQAKGDFGPASIELKNALQKNPKSAQARWLLGEIYVELGVGKDAEKELNKARELGVSEESIKVPLARALLLEEEFQRVLDRIQPDERASAMNRARILQLRGDALMGLRKWQEGCELYQKSVALDARLVPAYWGLARCATGKGDFAGARSKLEAALKLEQSNVLTWILLGDLRRAQGDHEAAAQAYDQAVKAGPKNLDALGRRAVIRLEQGKQQLAAADIDAMQKLAPRHFAPKYLRALALSLTGKHKEALDAVLEALRIQPRHVPGLMLAGSLYSRLGQLHQAEKILSQLVQAYPTNLEGRKWLTATLLRMGEAGRALEVLSPLLGPDQDDPRILAYAGEAYLRKGEKDKATRYLEKALSLDEKSVPTRVALANARFSSGNLSAGLAELQAAAETDPGVGTLDIQLIKGYIAAKEHDKALRAIDELEKQLTGQALPHNLRGTVLATKGDLAGARTSFERALQIQPGSTAAAMNLAQLEMQAKNPMAARRHLQNVLKINAKHIPAMLALADTEAMEGKETEAIAWLQKASSVNSSAIEPRMRLAALHLQKGRPQQALPVALEAHNARPDNPAVLDMLGAAQFAAGDKANALATYKKLLNLQPGSPLPLVRLAAVQVARQDEAGARKSLLGALALQPGHPNAQLALYQLEAKAGRLAEALGLARQIQGKRPALGAVLEGDVFMTQKRYKEALPAYEKAFGLNPNGQLAAKLHWALSQAGRSAEADTRIMKWLQQKPDDRIARAYLAQAYMESDRSGEAIQQYQILLQQDPRNLVALNNLAMLYFKAGDKQARTLAQRAIGLYPDNPAVADTYGWILVQQGEAGKGLEYLTKALAKAPQVPGLRYRQAVALAKAGRGAEARKALKDLLNSGKPFAEKQEAQALLQRL